MCSLTNTLSQKNLVFRPKKRENCPFRKLKERLKIRAPSSPHSDIKSPCVLKWKDVTLTQVQFASVIFCLGGRVPSASPPLLLVGHNESFCPLMAEEALLMAARHSQISVFRCGRHWLLCNSMAVAASCDPAELVGGAFLREQVAQIVCVDGLGFFAPRFCCF